MTPFDILTAERFGSRDYPTISLGSCANCGCAVVNSYGEPCVDKNNTVFCSEDCFKEFYGFKEWCDYEEF